MSKKHIALATMSVFGVAMLSSAATLAATYNLPWTKNIYNVSDTEWDNRNSTVSVFDDRDNKCYIVRAVDSVWQKSPDSVSISCMRNE